MTNEKIRAAVKIAQKAIELAHRVPPEGLKKSKDCRDGIKKWLEQEAEAA